MRLLTTKFTSFNIAKAERKYKKELVNMLDVGNLSVEKMLMLISIGNNNCEEEKAAEKLDNYLSDENNSIIDAYIQILEEIDMDLKLLSRSGMKISTIREQLNKTIKSNASKIEDEDEDEDEDTGTDERDYEHEFNPDLYSAR